MSSRKALASAEREAARKANYDAAIRAIVDAAPPLSETQLAKLYVIFAPARKALRAQTAASLERERLVEQAQDRAIVQRGLNKRKDPADIALEFVSRKIEELRAGNTPRVEAGDPVVVHAQKLRQKHGLTWAEAYGQAKAWAAAQRIDDSRRAAHEDNHLWCVPWECSVAAQELDPDDPDGAWTHCGHRYDAHGPRCTGAQAVAS